MKKLLSVFIVFSLYIGIFSINAFAGNNLDVKCKACVLMNADTGKVLYSQNQHDKLFIASVTKIMPMLLICEALDEGKISLTDAVTASKEASGKGGSQIWLKEGETMTVDELLKAVAIGSANDACCALAEYISGSEEEFVNLMNKRAKQLNMNDTYFENCSGLDDDTNNHKSSAYDIGIMGCELLKHKIIENYSTVWMDSLRNGKTELVNTNRLVRFYEGTTGLKTGTTQKAGKCLCASAKRGNIHLVAVVLGAETSDDRFEGAKTLLNYGFANFENADLEIDEKLLAPVKVIKGKEDYFVPMVEDAGTVTVEKGKASEITKEINLVTDVKAPVEKGQKIGSVTYYSDDSIIKECKIYAPDRIEKLNYLDCLKNLVLSLTNQ